MFITHSRVYDQVSVGISDPDQSHEHNVFIFPILYISCMWEKLNVFGTWKNIRYNN